jgi:LCP family protein required for cell wall assembly
MKKKKGKSELSGNKLGRGFAKFIIGVFSALLVLVLVAGLVLVIFYKSGEASLKASASSTAPVVTNTDEEQAAIEKAKSEFEYNNVIAWDDDWTVYEDKIYEYNEDTLNFVLMGIDKSGELSTTENYKYSKVGQADSIFLVSLNQKDKKVSIIGIPRNSMVEVEVFNSDKQVIETMYDALCLQYPYAGGGAEGLTQMKESVSELFYDLPIHGACAISFDAIEKIVDMIGGVEVTVPDDMTAVNASYTKGSTVTLTKKNVLEYLRYRDSSTLGSPTVRLTRQKDFMQSAINVAIKKVKENPAIVSDIYQAIMPYMNTDITLDKAVYLAKQAIGYSISSDSFYQLSGEDKKNYFDTTPGAEKYYDEYYLDEDYLKEVFMKVFYTQVVVEKTEQ